MLGLLAATLVSLRFSNGHLEDIDQLSGVSDRNSDKPVEEFDWKQLAASEDLVYTPCLASYGNFQCAKLKVPLDWTDPSDQRTAEIAIIKLPASIDGGEENPNWAGPILINPGGPGGSGIEMVQHVGNDLQILAGRNFSIIGFDPRGVGETTPSGDCFQNALDREIWQQQSSRLVSSGGPEMLGDVYVRARAYSKFCSTNLAKVNGTASYMGTSFVARDMLRITELSWKAVERESKGLQFWGFSYGSLLGQTFAHMFPDKVYRLILDGVVDAEDYYRGLWSRNLLNTNKSIQEFYDSCAANPHNCALAAGHEKADAKSIELRVTKILESLKSAPLPLIDEYPDLLTYSQVKLLLFGSLYDPLGYFPKVATLLAAAESGDSLAIMKLKEGYFSERFSCKFPDRTAGLRKNEAVHAISCGDADSKEESFEEFKEYYNHLYNQSSLAADLWLPIVSPCAGWKARSKERILEKIGKHTSEPLLFVGNDLDPVTPLDNAIKMSEAFPNSAVLRQKSGSHTCFNAPSSCTIAYIRQYLNDGTLPPKGNTCEPNKKPFEDLVTTAVDTEDDQLLAAMTRVSQSGKIVHLGHPGFLHQ
ncbi:alpha/beta-hydrolase [Ascobolus immersus RN42]|uniref:Alpha/beta-hydrolase n=1 Tax=Ascobolus immersus RN42 TaxID=1160509 RepID=A0A3N4J0J8_ASCIM|nr:alpha/beta-hydrolase [Ascobolus immersus RN42]